jgi:dTDP-4-amino-4,6-dideoxygalactose transaminase
MTLVAKPIPVARPCIGTEEEEGVLAVLRSGWITQGPRVAEFETRFASFVGCDHAVAVSSCTTALQLALAACGVGPGDEVICPSLSFIATANSIACLGATAVFGDIDLATYNIDPARVEELITPKTKAIMVVHQIGLAAEMSVFAQIAARHGLKLIEDAACAIGSEYEGNKIGRPIGDCACFSFHPRKILTTGEGGMITTRDPEMAARLRRLRQHAMSVSDVQRHSSQRIVTETYDEVGFNFRMTDMQAAVGIAQLNRLPDFLERRRFLANRYSEALADIPWIITPHVPDHCRHNYQSYMLRLAPPMAEERDNLMQSMLEKNISTRRGIMAIHRERPYATAWWDAFLPNTCVATDSCMILPLFHQMTEAEQDYIIEALQTYRP